MQHALDHGSLALETTLLCFALASACSSDLVNPDQELSDANVSSASFWTGSRNCDACLQMVCGDADAGSNAYGACDKDPSCRQAMTGFATCYAQQASLNGCTTAIETLRSASPAGSQLLDCFLLKCFFATCETIRPLTLR
jgi:hypothetical protein